MKNMRTLTALLVAGTIVTVSCKSQQKQQDTQPQPTSDPTVYKGVTDSNCAVEVAFGSYGSGIDGKAADKVQGVIDNYKVKFTTKNIGREGEFRYCLPLNELKGKKKSTFISELKKIAKEGQLVSVSIR
jgi:hypothetical protein